MGTLRLNGMPYVLPSHAVLVSTGRKSSLRSWRLFAISSSSDTSAPFEANVHVAWISSCTTSGTLPAAIEARRFCFTLRYTRLIHASHRHATLRAEQVQEEGR